jgi:predicted RNA binding protein YcfA (HicA-like mRNA interferase family)
VSPRQPVVSGKTLAKFLATQGFRTLRQKGSHLQLVKDSPAGRFTITVPLHREVARGTLNDILNSISLVCQIPKNQLLNDLARF